MRIVLLTNILTPYRIFFFDRLEGECRKRKIQFTVIVMAETEPGRDWEYSQYQRNYTVLLKGKSIVVQNIILHFNTGLKKIYQEIKPNIVVCAGSYLYPSLWETLRLKRKFHYKVLYWSESHLNERRNYSRLKYHVREQIRKRVMPGSMRIGMPENSQNSCLRSMQNKAAITFFFPIWLILKFTILRFILRIQRKTKLRRNIF